ncbi:Uncharacterised protein [Mycobacterium tuberculosis]|uniref:Uncharacterized protein n=1 Tax=Mycobacterium tuberculosis TaxID=1773 RepID=A0A916LBT1_MYCTX|nr:Uncharacterised protein [Mycobacterium tuberculosis]
MPAKFGVKIGQRFVHQEYLWAPHDRTTHRHPLPLAAGEIFRLAIQIRLQIKQFRCGKHPLADLGLADLGDLQREAHVLRHRHVRVEGVVLEHHGDITILGIDLGDVALADPDTPTVQRLQASHHP